MPATPAHNCRAGGTFPARQQLTVGLFRCQPHQVAAVPFLTATQPQRKLGLHYFQPDTRAVSAQPHCGVAGATPRAPALVHQSFDWAAV